MREGSNMSIQRVPEVPFAQIANSALRDTRLSFKARGVLALVLSNVGEWEATRTWLMSQSEKDGRHAIQEALNELTALGYRRVEKVLINGSITSVVEWRHEPSEPISRRTGNLTVGKPDGQETGPLIEHHLPEHHQPNTTREIVLKPVDVVALEGFLEFWRTYPRKEGKGHARQAWMKAIRKQDPTVIIEGAARYRDDLNRVKEFTAMPATWLNGERWEDEPLPGRVEDRRLDEAQQMIARAAARDADREGF
jgi:hypothetical protein